MKVKELMKVVHLYDGQETIVKDVETKEIFRTNGRYDFDKSVEDRVLDMKVNTFNISDSVLLIYARATRKRVNDD